MKSCFLCVACLVLVYTAISGTLGCDCDTGPAGLTQCFLDTPYYTFTRNINVEHVLPMPILDKDLKGSTNVEIRRLLTATISA